MAKITMKFNKKKIKVKRKKTREYKKIHRGFLFILLLISLNFFWDMSKRPKDLINAYEQTRPYYDIIKTEILTFYNNIIEE